MIFWGHVVGWLFQKKKKFLVLLSGFEVNKLMAYFREDRISLTRILPRMRQGQKLEINFNKVGIPDDLLQPMAIFSGNLYLNTQEEQKSYLNFIGYRPSPRTTKEEVLFEKWQIQKMAMFQKSFGQASRVWTQVANSKKTPTH